MLARLAVIELASLRTIALLAGLVATGCLLFAKLGEPSVAGLVLNLFLWPLVAIASAATRGNDRHPYIRSLPQPKLARLVGPGAAALVASLLVPISLGIGPVTEPETGTAWDLNPYFGAGVLNEWPRLASEFGAAPGTLVAMIAILFSCTILATTLTGSWMLALIGGCGAGLAILALHASVVLSMRWLILPDGLGLVWGFQAVLLAMAVIVTDRKRDGLALRASLAAVALLGSSIPFCAWTLAWSSVDPASAREVVISHDGPSRSVFISRSDNWGNDRLSLIDIDSGTTLHTTRRLAAQPAFDDATGGFYYQRYRSWPWGARGDVEVRHVDLEARDDRFIASFAHDIVAKWVPSSFFNFAAPGYSIAMGPPTSGMVLSDSIANPILVPADGAARPLLPPTTGEELTALGWLTDPVGVAAVRQSRRPDGTTATEVLDIDPATTTIRKSVPLDMDLAGFSFSPVGISLLGPGYEPLDRRNVLVEAFEVTVANFRIEIALEEIETHYFRVDLQTRSVEEFEAPGDRIRSRLDSGELFVLEESASPRILRFGPHLSPTLVVDPGVKELARPPWLWFEMSPNARLIHLVDGTDEDHPVALVVGVDDSRWEQPGWFGRGFISDDEVLLTNDDSHNLQLALWNFRTGSLNVFYGDSALDPAAWQTSVR